MVCSDRAGRIPGSHIWRPGLATPAEECVCGGRSSFVGTSVPDTITLDQRFRETRCNRFLERFYRLRLRDFSAALLAGAPRIIVPKIEHRLTEVFDDVAAVEIDIFH